MQRVGRFRQRNRLSGRDRLRQFVVPLGFAVVVVLLGACSSDRSGAEGETSDAFAQADPEGGVATAPIRTEVSSAAGRMVDLSLDGPHLAVVIDEGGLCGSGACLRVLEFAANGTWLLTDTGGQTSQGGFDVAVLADLARDSSDAQVNLGPFRGECPTTFDGDERSYLVYSPDDPTMTVLDLASCRDQIDANAPIMITLDLLALEASR